MKNLLSALVLVLGLTVLSAESASAGSLGLFRTYGYRMGQLLGNKMANFSPRIANPNQWHIQHQGRRQHRVPRNHFRGWKMTTGGPVSHL
jgi:hypothetical protein